MRATPTEGGTRGKGRPSLGLEATSPRYDGVGAGGR